MSYETEGPDLGGMDELVADLVMFEHDENLVFEIENLGVELPGPRVLDVQWGTDEDESY